jgi:glycosyltransferase involved in cell wall biosynthesis
VRIAIVGTELCAVDEHGGGLEQVLRRWATFLAARHDVTIVSHHPPIGPTHGVRLVSVGATADLAGALRGLRPDVVSLHNRPQWVRHCPPGSAPAVTFHNYPVAWKLGRATRLSRERGAVAPGVGLSAVSHALALASAARLACAPDAIVHTPPSIDAAYLVPRMRRPRRVVLSPNRLLRKKGVLELLAVAGRPEFADVTFAFADLISPWARPTREHLELRAAVQAVTNAVLFAPPPDATTLAQRYVESAVVVCPVQEEEGLGLVALEAQACGVPLVTTDLGGLQEATFAPNRSVPPGDPDALAAAITAALNQRASSAPRSAVIARYSPDVAGAAFERWLSGLTGLSR